MPSPSDSKPDTAVNPVAEISDEMPPKCEDEEEEDEDEDVDFNPSFLKETLSPEASSSLSSEVEAFDGDAVESIVPVPNSPTLAGGDPGDEEVVTQTAVSSERFCEKGTEGINDSVPEESVGTPDARKQALDSDAADAICMRTRARYSLASFTLDELETFLQETDDEDDLQNVDDEEEYRKFLASVLHGVAGDHDNDEDNDADFEVELEEALESSDADENADGVTAEETNRPQTRQNNRRQRAKAEGKKKHSAPGKRTLRPILPILQSFPASSFPAPARVDCNSNSSSKANAFTQQQIGQLHCLIHEHVQLLVQVFCLCSGDPSRQAIASQSQKLILEMLGKREQVSASKTAPYPITCFHPTYLFSLPPGDVLKSLPPSLRNATDQVCPASNEVGPLWVPCISHPVTTILDVAPLGLVGKFFGDVQTAVQESRLYTIGSSCESRYAKEPLFPLPGCQFVDRDDSGLSGSSGQQPCKKTLAATLVERTKKQSVALVPRHIMKSAQIFLPLFNPELYPHKPPVAAIANRVLFTDSEDELLAMGILECNTDWKAIQQRFLPCKSKHQIFVRQKNRCSSKARENPIKAVRRMKTSPLTEEEIACIHEGLKVFKCNLMMVWQFIVPHRDPSLLPRQWRIAHGTQKSYKINAEAKEKRRLNEVNRRRNKSAGLASLQNKENTQAGKLDRDNNIVDDNLGKTYVHEAFMADWRPHDSNGQNPRTNNMQSQGLFQQQVHSHSCGTGPQSHGGNVPNYSSMFMPQHPFHTPGIRQPGSLASTTKPQFCMKPYRSDKSYGKNLVKLAPGLPTLNLPPSVRVVSQSAFREAQPGTSSSVSAQPTHVGRSHINHVTMIGENCNNNTEGSEIAKEKCVDDEISNDTDLQMHPLLFQPADDGRFPYNPLNCGASSSGSFSFFSGNQPQLNLTLLHNPQHESHSGSFPSSFHSTDSALLSQGIDFHPLLQRNEYLLQYPFGATQTRSLANSDPHATGKPVEKANDLDLEIHLSSRAHKSAKSTSVAQDSGFAMEFQTSSRSFYRDSENPLPSTSNPGSGVQSPVSPTDGGNRYLDDACDQSNPGIVMEQEELSDSDEENEENVEFECEEMTDSEGDDGSDCEQITEMQTEEEHNLPMEKMGSDCEPTRTRSRSHEKLPSRRKKTRSMELGLTSQGKDDASNSSWLSLDSPGSQHCPENTAGNGDGDCAVQKENLTNKSLASSRPSRSCKKKNLSSEQVDQRRKTSSGPPQIPILRKPRKRVRRDDSSLNIELKVHNANPNGED